MRLERMHHIEKDLHRAPGPGARYPYDIGTRVQEGSGTPDYKDPFLGFFFLPLPPLDIAHYSYGFTSRSTHSFVLDTLFP